MIRKLIFILTIFFIFGVDTFAQEKIDISTVEPKLLWQKEFATSINSVAISSDGTKIALTVNPVEQETEDEKYKTWHNGKKLNWVGDSKLYYLDDKGNIIWEYEYQKKEPSKRWSPDEIFSYDGFRLKNLAMSDNGEYIACSVEELYSYLYPYFGRGIELRRETHLSEVLFLNSQGELLWTYKAESIPRISQDGRYVLLVPDEADDEPLDKFYFLNREGKKLWEIPGIFESYKAKMSKDGNYITIGDTLYDRDKNVLWKLEKYYYFAEISENNLFATAITQGPPGGWLKFLCLDLKQKTILSEIEPNEVERKYFVLPFRQYFIDESRKYLVTLRDEKLSERLKKELGIQTEEFKIYDLNTGKIVKKSLNPSDYYEYLRLYQGSKYKVELKGSTLYYHAYESQK